MIAYEHGPEAMCSRERSGYQGPKRHRKQCYRAEDLEGHRWMFMQR